MCDDCERDPQPAAVFCTDCKLFYCLEHEAAIHSGKRRAHARVPAGARPLQCPVHNQDATGYCARDKRLACIACLVGLPPGDCHPHLAQVKTIEEAATTARSTLEKLAQNFQQDEEGMQREFDGLTQVEVVVAERKQHLQAGMRLTAEGRAKMQAAAAVEARDKLVAQLQAAEAQAEELRAAMVAAVGDTAEWMTSWEQRCAAIVTHVVRRAGSCVLVLM
jgi:AraC-like DNA-binding protein